MSDPVYWFAVCTVVLFLKMMGLSCYQAYHRITRRAFKTPEDAAFVGVEPATEELPQVQRAGKAWLNDLENIPVFFALAVAYILVEASPAAAAWWFGIFTAARVLHSITYLAALQPWRTVFFGIALVCLLGMSVEILLALG